MDNDVNLKHRYMTYKHCCACTRIHVEKKYYLITLSSVVIKKPGLHKSRSQSWDQTLQCKNCFIGFLCVQTDWYMTKNWMYRTWIVAAQMQFPLWKQDWPQPWLIRASVNSTFKRPLSLLLVSCPVFYCVDGAQCTYDPDSSTLIYT